MKRIISVLIIALMLFSNVAVGFANTTEQNTEIGHPNLNNYLEAYSAINDSVSIVEETENQIVLVSKYNDDLDASTVFTTITSEENGDIKIVNSNEYQTDILIIKADGDMILNGAKILVETDTTYFVNNTVQSISPNSTITPFGRRYNKWTLDCPYGSIADYKDLRQTIKDNLTFEQTVASILENTLISILVSRTVRAYGMPTISEQIAKDVTKQAIKDVINYYKDQNPASRSMSLVCYQYIHSTKGEIINGEHIYMCSIKYYANSNYTGYIAQSGVMYNIIKTD